MYNTHIAHLSNYHRWFESGSRLLEFFTLSVKSAVNKRKDDNEGFSYFFNLIQKGSTVLDIGEHNDDYLYFLVKMAKRSGQLFAFESDPYAFNCFLEKKEILKLKNLFLEQLVVSEKTENAKPRIFFQKKNGAIVIDFKTRINQEAKKTIDAQSLDNYCLSNHIKPDYLKMNAKGNELVILNGAVEILQKYKPKILLECEEGNSGRENILKTFRLLTDLKYSGYFILDDLKLPLRNFDFSIYQNPLTNFYCKDFIFE